MGCSMEIKKPKIEIEELMSNISYGLTGAHCISQEEIDTVMWLCEYYFYSLKENELCKQIVAYEKEICHLENMNKWFKMWHEKFIIENAKLQDELETYRPTKLHGHGQCTCALCKEKGRNATYWTDCCYKYKGNILCSDCLKEILKNEKKEQLI